MNGIAKFLDFCIGRVKNQNTISTCEFFTVFVLDFNDDIVNDALRVVYFINRILKANGSFRTKHLGKLRSKFIIFYVITYNNHIYIHIV